jgi:monoamine oxidase
MQVTADSPTGNVTFTASAVLVTLPLGVLKKTHAEMFEAPLPGPKAKAIDKLGMGLLNKVGGQPSVQARKKRVLLLCTV